MISPRQLGFLDGYLNKVALESFEASPGGVPGKKSESENAIRDEDPGAAVAGQKELQTRLRHHLGGQLGDAAEKTAPAAPA